MKKGFILALLMVAMVAMVLPVSARAPIVAPLPTIIIGDSEGAVTSGSVQVGIMRYADALDLLDPTKINWNNVTDIYTSDLYHAYLLNPATGTPVPNILPYDATGIIDLLTTVEYANILADGTAPAASARITVPGAATQTMSLFDATRHPALVDVAAADPAVDGVELSTYTAETTLVFLAAVQATDSTRIAATNLGLTTSTADSVSPVKVMCQSSGSDSTTPATEPVVTYTFEGSVDGWAFATMVGLAFPSSVGGTGETGIGFELASAATALTHGSWLSPQTISGSSEQEGRVYRVVADLTSTASSSDTCSGWRLTFRNAGFAHYGKVTVETGVGEANAPASGTPYEARLYWAVPYFLGDMGDGEGQALAGPTGSEQDYRLYRITFDSIATAGDTGRLIMEEVELSYILRPSDPMDAEIEWGTDAGQTPFNAAVGEGQWKAGASLSSMGFTDGNVTVNAGSVVLAIGSATGSRYASVTSQDNEQTGDYLPVNQLKPVSSRLYRFSFAMACGSQASVPTYRCNINGLTLIPGVSLVDRKITWGQYFAYSNLQKIGKEPFYVWPAQSATVCPGAPGTSTPTTLETYVWSHSVAPQTASLITTIVPLMSVVDVGNFQVTGSEWNDPTTNMTISSAKWEDLGSDY